MDSKFNHMYKQKNTFHIFFDLPSEGSAISLKDSYIELDFNVTHRACAHN